MSDQDLFFSDSGRILIFETLIRVFLHDFVQKFDMLNIDILNLEHYLLENELRSNERYDIMRIKRGVKDIKSSAGMLNDDLNKLQDLLGNRSTAKEKNIDIRESIRNCIDLMASRFYKEKIKVDVNVQKNISIIGKENQFTIIIINILFNCIQSFFDTSIEDRLITIEINNNDAYIEIRFVDNGRGISTENLDKIYDPGFTTYLKASGLGLTVTKRILEEELNGTIEVKSEEGLGTTAILKFLK
ncbi:sensor histidine kinase [Winogradskyella sp.]|uniref:sensor histidine kinase n=1 Tax=Winogradskyella sp. TaxID=1883156 RepID=UPI003BA8DCF6